METKFNKGDIVHCDEIYPFKDCDGTIKEVVIRDENWLTRDKYLVEITVKNLFGKEKKKTRWFIGTSFLASKTK